VDLTIRTAAAEDFAEIAAVDGASFGVHYSAEELADVLTLIDPARFLVATDARRKEVYWARYGADHERLDGPHVATPAGLAHEHPELPAYGRGAEMYAGVLRNVGAGRDPRAAALAQAVVAGIAVELPLEPLYLRRPDATPQVVSPRT